VLTQGGLGGRGGSRQNRKGKGTDRGARTARARASSCDESSDARAIYRGLSLSFIIGYSLALCIERDRLKKTFGSCVIAYYRCRQARLMSPPHALGIASTTNRSAAGALNSDRMPQGRRGGIVAAKWAFYLVALRCLSDSGGRHSSVCPGLYYARIGFSSCVSARTTGFLRSIGFPVILEISGSAPWPGPTRCSGGCFVFRHPSHRSHCSQVCHRFPTAWPVCDARCNPNTRKPHNHDRRGGVGAERASSSPWAAGGDGGGAWGTRVSIVNYRPREARLDLLAPGDPAASTG